MGRVKISTLNKQYEDTVMIGTVIPASWVEPLSALARMQGNNRSAVVREFIRHALFGGQDAAGVAPWGGLRIPKADEAKQEATS